MTCPTNAYLAQHEGPVRPAMHFGNGVTLSVQASTFHYCLPKSEVGPWDFVEVGRASHRLFPELRGWRSGGHPDEVHGWVPVRIINAIIARLGEPKTRAPLYVIWKGPAPWVLSLDGYPSRTEAMRAIRWQEVGGSSTASDWAICERTGPASFKGPDGVTYETTAGGRTVASWLAFTSRWDG